MNADELKALQAPIKALYKENPEAAKRVFRAEGRLLPDRPVCRIETRFGIIDAGLHPAAGGDGSEACSGDMLLEALVACAGVTLNAVATAIGVELRGGTVSAEGDLDFRGTLAVAKEAPVGFRDIRLRFDLETDADKGQLDTLIRLTERYCVVYQTLRNAPTIAVSYSGGR